MKTDENEDTERANHRKEIRKTIVDYSLKYRNADSFYDALALTFESQIFVEKIKTGAWKETSNVWESVAKELEPREAVFKIITGISLLITAGLIGYITSL